ncbi:unnamed protein product [Parnassius apollo]|uniref:(apollo) hypothetical protein n=1 Tax=Parnassius apollo TaxID=110799 RepID=A0A8S3XLH4_PARAO|nr:unnamed protein product [Parnassius apollo]
MPPPDNRNPGRGWLETMVELPSVVGEEPTAPDVGCCEVVREEEGDGAPAPEGERLPGDGASCSAPEDQNRVSEDGSTNSPRNSLDPFRTESDPGK